MLIARKQSMFTVHEEELIAALKIAIANRIRYERDMLGYQQDSALVTGWKDLVEALKAGEYIQIIK